MSQKTIIVSGASGNLGKAVVNHFIQKDYKVNGLVHRQSEKKDDENYQEYQVDLLDEKASQACVSKIIAKDQQINSAVLTAGGFKMGTIAKTSVKDLEHQYQLNFQTAYNLARPILTKMQEQGQGTLFFIGSEPGMDTRKAKSTVAYSLSKSLLFQLANIINTEAKNTAIKAYVVVPSTIDTPQNREAVPDADFSKWEKPEDIAEIIAKYVNQSDDKTKSTLVIQDEL